jgi:hypothetical protein
MKWSDKLKLKKSEGILNYYFFPTFFLVVSRNSSLYLATSSVSGQYSIIDHMADWQETEASEH